MMELLQLELPVADAAEISEVIGQTRATGILPRYNETAGFSDDDMHELCRAFIEGSRSAVERQAAADRVLFAARVGRSSGSWIGGRPMRRRPTGGRY